MIFALPLMVGFLAGYTVADKRQRTDQISRAEDSPATTTASYQTSAQRDSTGDQISGSRHTAITRAVAIASPAVVGINVTEVQEYRDPWSADPFFRQFFGDRVYRQEVKGLGSGFIISPDGYILTNDHVAGNAKEITVTLTSKEKYKAELVGTDPASDVALLKIDGKNFPSLQLGNSSEVLIGEWAIAMGNPFGLFEISDKPTVTVGVVSATGMNLSEQQGRYYRDMIQTDAAINGGNSGGPLLNSLGEVIGMNTLIYTGGQTSTYIGYGFALPVNRVKRVVEELRKNGKIDRNLWTGMDIQSVDMRVARYFGLTRAEGVIVSDIKRNSPADRAGFKPGDIIVSVNGEAIANDDDFNGILVDSKPGDVLRMKVMREKKEIEMSLKLERRPS
ncbi:MAG: trypsin-like peptidase domain-containing protein [Ignavibacteriae bacterium]|nr:trypsin-like peptidase domain-containing protein [Ignavibacteria bacterium]MBI3364509.1 trypsin-like peptidase domain-containing protein [Ignavibacteriota bacterium]